MNWQEYEERYGESKQELMQSEQDEHKPKDIAELHEAVVAALVDLEKMVSKLGKIKDEGDVKDVAYELEEMAAYLDDLASEDYADYDNCDGCADEEERIFGPGGFHGWANPGLGGRLR